MKCVRTQSSSAVVSRVPTGRREMDRAVDASDVGPGDAHGFLAHESTVDRDDPLAEPTTEAGAVRGRTAEDGADDRRCSSSDSSRSSTLPPSRPSHVDDLAVEQVQARRRGVAAVAHAPAFVMIISGIVATATTTRMTR